MNLSIKSFAALLLLTLAPAAFADQIDNPEYAQWSKFTPGTSITIQQSSEIASMPQMAAMMPQTKITTKLTEVKPEALTLELVTASTTAGQTRETKRTRIITAKIDKPTTAPATAPTTAASELKDLKEGRETIEIVGKKIDTTTREYTTTTTVPMGRGPGSGTPVTAHIKIWNSPEIPGGMVKTESTSTVEQMGDIKMTMMLVDFTVGK